MRSTSRWGLTAVAVGIFCLQSPASAQEEAKPQPKYVGTESCGTCHKSKTKGNQLGVWKESQHAQAYAVLATPEAKEIAKGKGIEDPQKADACLKCHITAHGVDDGLIKWAVEGKKGHKVEDGVGCESCHGPGSLYKSRKVMKDREAAIAAGLVIPDEKTCKKCHNEESPTYKAFDFAERAKKIAHPNPKKAAAGEGK